MTEDIKFFLLIPMTSSPNLTFRHFSTQRQQVILQ